MQALHSLSSLVVTGVIGAMGLLCGLGFLAAHWNVGPMPKRFQDAGIDPAGWRARMRRRLHGAGLMAIIGPMFFVGVNYLRPEGAERSYVAFWLVLLGMLVWLVSLAVIDVVQIQRWIHKIHRQSHHHLEEILARAKRNREQEDED